MLNGSGGFTKIELLMSSGIVGVLSVIAIPMYLDYVVRSKVAEIMQLINKDEVSIAEYYSARGRMPTAAQSGLTRRSAQSRYLTANVALARSGTNVARVTYTLGNFNTSAATGTIILIGTGTANGVTWNCTAGTFPAKYRPANCRP